MRSFNPRPCVRGDLGGPDERTVATVFQSAPLREGRPAREELGERIRGFNPRPCVRGDRGSLQTLFL